ncbi:MAG: sugar ABC transporter permease [Bacilli bacterium]|nr:sugar ABC transporter permease [Bacilli bacterium]
MNLTAKSNLRVTEREKKLAKKTGLVFSILTGVFAILVIVLACLYPRSSSIYNVGDSGEPLTAITTGKDGETYFVNSDNYIARYNSSNNELISTIPFHKIIEEKVKKDGSESKLLDNSLKQFAIEVLTDAKETDYLVFTDSNGNMFKFIDDGVNLTICDDYYISNTAQKIRGTYCEGDNLYSIFATGDTFNFYTFDVSDLTKGILKNKPIWAFSAEDGNLSRVGDTEALYDLFAITKDSGETIFYVIYQNRIIRFSDQFYDIDVNGKKIDIFNSIETGYGEYLITRLKEIGVPEEEYEGLTNAKLELLYVNKYYEKYKDDPTSDIYQKSFDDALVIILNKTKNGFSTKFATDNEEWVENFSYGDKAPIKVKQQYYALNAYSELTKGQELTVGGMAYSRKNKILYLADSSANKFYSITPSAIDERTQREEYNKRCFTYIKEEIPTLNFSGGTKFSSTYQCIKYNRHANSLFLIYSFTDDVSLIDLNLEKPQVSYSFKLGYDINQFAHDKTNAQVHCLRKDSRTMWGGETSTYYLVNNIDPVYASKAPIFKTMLIIFGVLCGVCLIVAIVAFVCSKHERSAFKLRIARNDVVKHRFTYIALIPFVALLFLFCYYEAIGSLSMSFFSYTISRPTWQFNNFANFITIFSANDFWLSVGNMIFFLISDLIICLGPPLIFAFCLTIIRNKKYSGLMRALMFIPGIVPGIATMLLWRTGIYGDDGILNSIYRMVTGNTDSIGFLTNVNTSRWWLILMGFPFVGSYLIFYGGLMNVPREYYEACDLEGLPVLKRFVKIDIPLISPQIKYILIMTIISSVQNYGRTYILGSAGTITPAQNMYTAMKLTGDYGLAGAYAVLIFLFLFGAVFANFKSQKKNNLGDSL